MLFLDQPGKNAKDFNTRLVYCIDCGLSHFGAAVQAVIYWNFETEYGHKKEEIPLHMREFLDFLAEVFGKGAQLIERSIAEQIAIEFSVPQSNTTNSSYILELIETAKNQWIKGKKG